MVTEADSRNTMSVVIPVKDRSHLICRCLDSVRSQTWRPIKIILVDNGSSDDTVEVAERWRASNSEPGLSMVILHEPQPGASCARNRGLYNVDTDFVMFFDSDDTMRSGLVETAMAYFLKSQDVDIVYWRGCINHANGHKCLTKFNVSNQWRYHIYHALLRTLGYAVRSEFIRRVGGWNSKLSCWDDWELGVRLLLGNPGMNAIDETLVDIYPQKKSITGENFFSKSGEWEKAVDAAEKAVEASSFKDLAWLIQLINYRRVNLAALYRHEGRKDLAEPLLEKALRHGSLNKLDKIRLRLIYLYTGLGMRGGYMFWK